MPPGRYTPRMWLLLACATPAPEDTAPIGGTCAKAPTVDIAGAIAGTREADVAYTIPWSGEQRALTMHAWYPTADASGDAAEWLGLFDDEHSWVDASLAPATCIAPLVVYSHGSQAWAGNASPLLRQFVAAGWIAAGPDHTGNTLDDNLDTKPETFPLLRTLDVRATIDWIDGLPQDDPLYGRVDTSKVLVFGHSYGGQTSWLLSGPTFDAAAIDARCAASALGCTDAEVAAYTERSVDPRIVAVAPLAGSAGTDLVADEGWATMDRPVLYMTGAADNDGSEPSARASEGDVTWVELAGGCHESFTATTLPCDLDKELGLGIVATYLTAFGSHYVWGWDDGGILDGTVQVDPVATIGLY